MSENQEDSLLEMLERPDMTYTNPGRKDNIYIGKIDGERCYVQKRYLLWNLRDALEILNGQEESFKVKFGEPLTFTKFYQFIKKKKQFIFQRDIPYTSCLCEICENTTLMAKAIGKEKKAIQQHHMILPKNTPAIPAIQIVLVTNIENSFRQKCFQDGMKLLLQKALQKDNQAVIKSPTKLLIHNGLERIEKLKKKNKKNKLNM